MTLDLQRDSNNTLSFAYSAAHPPTSTEGSGEHASYQSLLEFVLHVARQMEGSPEAAVGVAAAEALARAEAEGLGLEHGLLSVGHAPLLVVLALHTHTHTRTHIHTHSTSE